MAVASVPLAGSDPILASARAGDRRAVAVLMARFRPLVVRLSRPYFAAGLEREDLVQEGLIGLYHALRAFRPERGVPFERLAAVFVRRHLASTVRTANRLKTQPLTSYVSLEETAVAAACRSMRAVEAQAGYEQVLGSLRAGLSEFEATVLERLLEGLSPAEVAQGCGCSQKAIANAIARIRDKARHQGGAALFSH